MQRDAALSFGEDKLRTLRPVRNKLVVAHELRKRLRLKMPLLRTPRLDTGHLASLVGEYDGVDSVRINAAASSIVIAYDGSAGARQAIFDRLSTLSPGELQFNNGISEPSFAPIALRLGLLLAMPVLPAALSHLLIWGTIAPRLARGVWSVFTKGVSVELLDAVAVALGARMGRYTTALVTDTLMASGDYLEETTERHSEDLLTHLLYPHPSAVWVERDGRTIKVPFAEVGTGEIVVAGTGELIPIDGVIAEGVAQVNQASVTGESIPVGKEAGDRVIAGSIVESGRLKIEARQVGDETTTARIAAFIHESLTIQSNTERVAEEFANQRVLLTLGLGIATFLLTRDITRVMSVLLIDYSCAVKLSAPVAVRSTMSDAADRGVLIKGGPSIEDLAKVDTMVFDKTGTLTRGDLAVTDIVPLAPELCSEHEMLAMAASIEEHSRHPIADAVVSAARSRGLDHVDHDDIDVEIAHGLRTKVDGKRVVIGSRHFLQDHEGIDLHPYEATAHELSGQGKMLLYAAYGGTPVGIIAIRDELRAESAETMQRLREFGVERLIMLTGDREQRAKALAAAVGVDEVFAELQPEDKADIVKRLQGEGRRVAFVGDGINDAPALATADVGIAMPRGADIARATADIVLLRDDLAMVGDAREAAQTAMAVIRSNFRAAIGINTGLYVLASLGWLRPVAAAILHNGTTLALLGRALSATDFPEPDCQTEAEKDGPEDADGSEAPAAQCRPAIS
ncbi:heavy metal translocating P-type ATPase [Methyloligella sp. 2.7D]|uniref:heavy metal translocating P-type ATPase n=1 Tax=unclassified Methyloligella TaxID=2625955 RepID=UPI00157D1EEA|nr:heavy metal translocating P-type ATPase [Methyloligella sp. GL2]QKP78108.1 heavy metal translocating P-type ATPase [Methyloligella sp. GL2]